MSVLHLTPSISVDQERRGADPRSRGSVRIASPRGRRIDRIICLGSGPESHASAEVLHGPVSIVDSRFPIIAVAAQDAAEMALNGVADEMARKGARVFATSPVPDHAQQREATRTGYPLKDPIPLIAGFYAMVEQVAAARSIDPDAPRHLSKVTKTR